ncbi:hypothetical protein BMT54_04565 [Pasteurellaceae bacterium 15-036681]|nr:hypothetical protein BMT54_04565 [Pasteurellaceae bacterium 15-036681]
MQFFRPRHKSTFLSQILLGVLAIFALPSVYGATNENDQASIVNQQVLTLSDLSAVTKADIEQAHLLQLEKPHVNAQKQAVVFTEFFTPLYAFESIAIPPIRAGPHS